MKVRAFVLGALLALVPVVCQAAVGALSLDANAKYLSDFQRTRGVYTLPSGVAYKILHTGFGKRPGPTDQVTVYYTGALINGAVFDGTEPGLPSRFKVNALIPGWTQALQMMREGDHWQIVIPAEEAYGTRGAGGGSIPPNQVLVFDLTLVKVETPKEQDQQQGPDTRGNGGYGP
jgi:FKBP-type peptidyl-prolyl cis-trans isomerase FklB